MTRLTTLLTATALATAVASPAFACSWGKTASHDMKTMAEVKTPEVTEEAMTTFDPAGKPVFEEVTEAKADEIVEDEAKSE